MAYLNGNEIFFGILGGTSGSSLPIEISTEAEMTALLETAPIGAVYKYVGESTDTYENGGLYIVEASSGVKCFKKLTTERDIPVVYLSISGAQTNDTGNVYIKDGYATSKNELKTSYDYCYDVNDDVELYMPVTSGYISFTSEYAIDTPVSNFVDVGSSDFYVFKVTSSGIIAITYMCFVAGTQITLTDGNTKSVEDVTYDDELLVWDFDNGCYASARPLWILAESVTNRYYHLVFEDGKTLDVIVDHRGLGHRVFCLDTNRFEYSHTCVGKRIATQDGVATMVSCDVIEDTVKYYNIITDYHMNLYANDILTSTGLNNLYPIKDMRFVKEERTLIPFSAFDNCPEKYYYGLRLGEQVDYTMERLNEKIEVLINGAIENRNEPSRNRL